MQLTAIFTSFDKHGRLQSSLSVEVDYSPEDMTVTEVLNVFTTDHDSGIQTPITELVLMNMNAGIEEIIENTDWWKLYFESSHYQESTCYVEEAEE